MKKNLQRFGASVLAAAMVAQSVALPAAAETTKIDSSVAQSVAASAASAASAVQSLPKFTSTADLIKQTAQTLAAQGEVHELEQDDAKLEATAQSKAGMSLAALENALADAMYANAAAGKINTEAYGLNKDEMASVMAATIKTYHLSSAVTDLGYETNAAGVVTAVTFTGSSGMTSAMESMTNSDDEVIAQQADSYAQAYVAENSDTFTASAAADGHTYGEPKWYWNDTNPEDGHTHTWKETPDGYWTKTDDGWAYTAVYTCEKDDAYQKLWDQIDAIRKTLQPNHQTLKVGDVEITSTSTKTDIIQKITTAVSLNNMNEDQLAKILKEQEKLAQDPNKKVWVNEDTVGTQYEEMYHELRNNYYTGGTNDYLQHLELITDSTLHLLPDEGGSSKTTDCLIIRNGLQLEWNYNVDDLLNKPASNQKAGLAKNIGFDKTGGIQGFYEYARTENQEHNNNPNKSAFYRLTGTVVYDALTDTDGAVQHYASYDAAVAAYKAAMEAQGKEVTDADIQRQVVRLSDQSWYDANKGTPETVWYQVYLNNSKLSAYGYMDVSSNKCANATKARWNHSNSWYGGYDLKSLFKSGALITLILPVIYIFYTMTVFPAF